MGMNVRTVDLQHVISISDERTSGPWQEVALTLEVESAISLSVERASGPMLTNVWTECI
jgi:hypothetical protein